MAQITKVAALLFLVLMAVIDLQSSHSQAAEITQDGFQQPSLNNLDADADAIEDANGMSTTSDVGGELQATSDLGRRMKRSPGTCVNRWYNTESGRESDCRQACRNDGCYSGFCQGEYCRCFHRNYNRCV